MQVRIIPIKLGVIFLYLKYKYSVIVYLYLGGARMELIKDIIKIDSRIDFGKYQTFIESEAVVPDVKLDVYEIVDTQGYIALSKIEITDGKLVCRGSFNYNVMYIADDKSTLSNVCGKIDINEVIEKDNLVQDMEYMLYPEVEHVIV